MQGRARGFLNTLDRHPHLANVASIIGRPRVHLGLGGGQRHYETRRQGGRRPAGHQPIHAGAHQHAQLARVNALNELGDQGLCGMGEDEGGPLHVSKEAA